MVEAVRSMRGTGAGVVAKHSIYEIKYVAAGGIPPHTVGDRLALTDGRVFYYSYNCDGLPAGTPAELAPGLMLTTAAPIAHHRTMSAYAAAVVGAKRIKATSGGTTILANYYAGGYVHLDTGGTGYGRYYRILSHDANTTTGSFWIYLYDPLETAITTSTKVTLTANPWANVIIFPATSATGMPVGIPLVTVTISSSAGRYYFWCQTWGPAAVLCNTTMGVGLPIGTSGTAGSGLTHATTTNPAFWGVVINPCATTTHSLVYLMIAP